MYLTGLWGPVCIDFPPNKLRIPACKGKVKHRDRDGDGDRDRDREIGIGIG